MRIDHKNLRKWLQAKLDYYEIDAKVIDSYSTRFTPDQYEKGACRMIFNLSFGSSFCSILCFWSINEIRDALKRGMSLSLQLKERQYLEGAEITCVRH